MRRMSWNKVKSRILPGLPHIHRSRVRRCQCCGNLTVILSMDLTGEISRCIRCGANFRYELLAGLLRDGKPTLSELDIVELDPDSPLRPLLSMGRSYLRTFYSDAQKPGTTRADGARCEDVTALTLPDQSADLLVSSEVLEHVPDLALATREISRVLRPGGRHIFTVPTVPEGPTICRARIEAGRIEHLVTPEYHGDPLGKGQGILAFWTFGRDAGTLLSNELLRTELVAEQWYCRTAGFRAVWQSTRL